ncbi:MAG: class I SAM-dependent methyltransferase [Paracoccaceae bacterium]
MRDLDKYSKSYSDLEFENEIIKYRRLAVLERIDHYFPMHILEVGCGLEPLFLHLPTQMHVTVVEPTKAFYENADLKSQGFENAQVLHTKLEDACLETQFDMIIVSCLLHEIEDQTAFLKKLHNISCDNTIIHINVPNAMSMHRRLAVSMGLISSSYEISETQKKMQQSHPPFDSKSLKYFLTTHNFKVCNFGGYFIKPFTHTQMMQLLHAGVANEMVLDGLFELGTEMPELASEIWVDCKKYVC